MKILCTLGFHKWKPLHFKSFESYTKSDSQYSRITDSRVTREYCTSCGKIRNLVEFEKSIV